MVASGTVTKIPNPKVSPGLEAAKDELREPERTHLQVILTTDLPDY